MAKVLKLDFSFITCEQKVEWDLKVIKLVFPQYLLSFQIKMSVTLQNNHLVRTRSLEPICQPLRKPVSFLYGPSQGVCPFSALGSAPPPYGAVSFHSPIPRGELCNACPLVLQWGKALRAEIKTPLHRGAQITMRWSLNQVYEMPHQKRLVWGN